MSAGLPVPVLFDFGDVLARYDPGPRMEEYARRSGLARTAFRFGIPAAWGAGERRTGRTSTALRGTSIHQAGARGLHPFG